MPSASDFVRKVAASAAVRRITSLVIAQKTGRPSRWHYWASEDIESIDFTDEYTEYTESNEPNSTIECIGNIETIEYTEPIEYIEPIDIETTDTSSIIEQGLTSAITDEHHD
jgi:hypothetical protein